MYKRNYTINLYYLNKGFYEINYNQSLASTIGERILFIDSNLKQRIDSNKLEEFIEDIKDLIHTQLEIISLPQQVLQDFEPSQVGTIMGSLMDACLPNLSHIPTSHPNNLNTNLTKYAGETGARESYPDYKHSSGLRIELKLVFKGTPSIEMNKPTSLREPSARLSESVTMKNISANTDILMILTYSLEPNHKNKSLYTPTIKDIGLFPIYDCVVARDKRMIDQGGKWFGTYETPTVLSKQGKKKIEIGLPLDSSTYGIKEAELKDFNKDRNFGKLNRIPYGPLQRYIELHKEKL